MVDIASNVRQQETTQPGRYQLRHIAPKKNEAGEVGGIIDPFGTGYPVLSQTLYAEPLPVSRLPSSPDFHEGKYTLRMLDAGDFELAFPNKDASDGRPWRDRFSSNGHREFIEISREGEIEFIGVVVKEVTDREKITISGYDPFFLLKKAFEQEYTAVQAPRDVIERYSQVWVTEVAATFPGSSLSGEWTVTKNEGTSSVTVANGRATLAQIGNGAITITNANAVTVGSGRAWSVRATVWCTETEEGFFSLAVGGVNAVVLYKAGTLIEEARLNWSTTVHSGTTTIPFVGVTTGSHTLLVQSDGRWVSAYVDGLLVGLGPAIEGGAHPEDVALSVTTTTGVATMEVGEVIAKALTPFLMRGSEKGDYVLPGTASTYPTGGLHGRFIVNGATTSAERWWETILAPDPRRTGFPEYIQEQNPILSNPAPDGVPTTYWAARWFGAVYLPLSKGNLTLSVSSGKGCGHRVWVGKTQFGSQVIDAWTTPSTEPLFYNATINAAALGGKDGWYPIIVEFYVGPENVGSESLYFTPAATYTDPGGTALTGGLQYIIPSTSLSPLGCVDARIQGSSFVDLVQETAKNYGYQLLSEPQQLESGKFPGQIVPKARVGRETDEIVEADDIDRRSGINNYTQTLDATDAASSVKAFGSGIADGKGSQISFEAVSIPDEQADLFDLQAWCSATDIAFPALLAARAQAELALRLGSWENVEGEPIARDRLADTFPLTGVLSAFRWHIGDGVRLWLPDVGVEDTTPRPIFQVVRSFTPEGRVNTQIGFRARPKDPVYALRTALRETSRSARAYQRQYVTRSSSYVNVALAAGAFTEYTHVPLSFADRVVNAVLLITANSAGKKLGIEINETSRTAALGGPWTSPVAVNVVRYAVPFSTTNLHSFFRIKNEDVAETTVQVQLVVTLLV